MVWMLMRYPEVRDLIEVGILELGVAEQLPTIVEGRTVLPEIAQQADAMRSHNERGVIHEVDFQIVLHVFKDLPSAKNRRLYRSGPGICVMVLATENGTPSPDASHFCCKLIDLQPES